MPKPLSLLFLFFIALTDQAQVSLPHTGFGEGIIHVCQYSFASENLVPENPALLEKVKNPYDFVYYIKENKILRNDQQKNDSLTFKSVDSTDTMKDVHTTIQAEFVHPRYLIDWNKRMVYTFFRKNGEQQIAQRPLKEDSTELFYRLADSNQTSIKSIDNRLPVFISNRKCFKGAAIMNGEEIRFYYSPDLLKVHSPLNGFVPKNFPYEVLSVRVITDWTTPEGKPTKGAVVFQVAEIKECELDDAYFILPENVIIRKNVPMKELYFPENLP